MHSFDEVIENMIFSFQIDFFGCYFNKKTRQSWLKFRSNLKQALCYLRKFFRPCVGTCTIAGFSPSDELGEKKNEIQRKFQRNSTNR